MSDDDLQGRNGGGLFEGEAEQRGWTRPRSGRRASAAHAKLMASDARSLFGIKMAGGGQVKGGLWGKEYKIKK